MTVLLIVRECVRVCVMWLLADMFICSVGVCPEYLGVQVR